MEKNSHLQPKFVIQDHYEKKCVLQTYRDNYWTLLLIQRDNSSNKDEGIPR